MSTRPTRDIQTNLEQKGFKQDSTHHQMYWLYIGERKTSIRTRISHSEREYGDNLLGQMAKQVRLPKKKFLELIDCSLVKNDYFALLEDRDIIRLPKDPPESD